MRITTLLALPTITSAWTFVLNGKVWDAPNRVPRGCTNANGNVGQGLEWTRGFWDRRCCIRLYTKQGCVDQNGLSCPSWKKKLGQDVRSFKVTC